MGSPSIPQQPAPPDYAAANKEGIQTDISTLPLRNKINQAATLGQRIEYQDPTTGETKVADFTGMGNAEASRQAAQILTDSNAAVQRQQLQLREELGVKNAQQTAAELRAADPASAAVRDALTSRVNAELTMGPATIGSDGKLGAAADRLGGMVDQAPNSDPKRLADLYAKAGQVTDTGRLEQLLGAAGQQDGRLGSIYNDLGRISTSVDDAGAGAKLGALEQTAQQRLGTVAQDALAGQRLNSLYGQANRLQTNFTDASRNAMDPALQQALGDMALGGKLNQAELRQVTDNARAGQAARGNYLGDAAAVQEGIAQMGASDAKYQQRLGNLMALQGQLFGQSDSLRQQGQAASLAKLGQLQSLQGTGFGQNQSLRNEDRASAQQQIDTLGGLAQQLFGNSQSLRNEQRAAQLAKAQAMAGLQGQDFGQGMQRINTQAGLAGQIASQGMQGLNTQAGLLGQGFNQDQQAYTTRLNAAGSALQGQQAAMADGRANRQEGFGYDQQRLANASSMVLGMPVTSQFGGLNNAQQGAVGFTPVNYQPVGQLNQNAGQQAAQFGQQNFGQLANMWGQQAQIASQGNPWMSLAGNVAGAAAGAMI